MRLIRCQGLALIGHATRVLLMDVILCWSFAGKEIVFLFCSLYVWGVEVSMIDVEACVVLEGSKSCLLATCMVLFLCTMFNIENINVHIVSTDCRMS